MKNANNMIQVKVLVIEEDERLRTDLSFQLEGLGHQVFSVASVQEARVLSRGQPFDLVLASIQLGNQAQWDFVQEINSTQEDVTTVAMINLSGTDSTLLIAHEGALECLPKPVIQAQLFHLLQRIQKRISLTNEHGQFCADEVFKDCLSGFTSSSVASLEEFINSVSSSNRPILLRGESGTGKRTLARLIHERSKKKDKPFVTVFCAATEAAIGAELLSNSQVGSYFEGTLFLDEVGDLSLPGQVKLLRFLRDGTLEKENSSSRIKVNARLIASTRKNLEEAVRQGSFREDLHFRLNALECEVVPLRHRKEDIPVLIQRYVKESADHQGLTIPPPIPEVVMKELLSYPWPGNLRELRNVIGRLVVLSVNRPMCMNDLPVSIRAQGQIGLKGHSKFATLEEIEKQHIVDVLRVESNQEKAAEILGITTVTLWKKRKTYGLP